MYRPIGTRTSPVPEYFSQLSFTKSILFSEILQARGMVPSFPPVPLPSCLVTATASHNFLPEVQAVLQLSPLRDNESISRVHDAASPRASDIVAKNELSFAAEQPPDDENAALETYPPVRLSAPEEEKPTMISLKTAEEDEIDLKISQLLVRLIENGLMIS